MYLGKELTEDNRVALDRIIKDQGPEKTIVMVNGDFKDEEDVPGGMVTVFRPDQKIHVDSIPQEAFMYTTVTKIVDRDDGAEWTDKDFTGSRMEEALNAYIPQYAPNPPQLKSYHGAPKDDKPWNAELGGPNTFAGIYKKVDTDNARQTHADYYIVTQASVPIVASQLRAKLIKNPDMTYKDLLTDVDFTNAHYVAERNAARLAYQVARAIGVPIRHGQDHGMMLQEQYSAPGMRAKPNMSQPVSMVKEVPGGNVAVFNKVRPISDAAKTCLVYAGPFDGVVMFNMNGKSKNIGLPADTGRNQMPPDPNTKVDYKKRARGIIWEGKNAQNPMHPDLHPEAFNQCNAEFREAMEQMGWNPRGANVRFALIPVLTKIFNPEIKRQ